MKKIKLLLLAAALLCAAFSCEKAEAPKSSMEPEMVSLILSTEKSTKTHISNVTDANGVTEIHWDQGDRIKVFSNYTIAGDDASDYEFKMPDGFSPSGKYAKFGGEIRYNTSIIWAVYPYDKAKSATKSGVLTVSIPSSQNPTSSSFASNLNVSVAASTITKNENVLNQLGSYELNEVVNADFKNVCALLKFTAPADAANITSVTISANEPIAGNMTIDYSKIDDIAYPKVTGVSGSKSITMTGSFEADKEYYFVVAPVSISGISMTIQANGETRYLAKKVNYALEPGVAKSLGSVDLAKMYKVTASAAHQTPKGVLSGTNITFEAKNAKNVADNPSVSLTVKKSGGNATRNVKGLSSAYTSDSTWPYLPKGAYTFSGSLTSNGVYVHIPSTSFTVPTLTQSQLTVAEFTPFTSYTKYAAGKPAEANALDGSTIYVDVTININSSIVGNTNYSDLILVNGSKPVYNADKTCVCFGGNDWQSHTISQITWTFDEVTASHTLTAAKTVHVTGIPYDYSFRNKTLAEIRSDNWTPNGDADIFDLNVMGLSLYKGLFLSSRTKEGGFLGMGGKEVKKNGYMVSRPFYIPANTDLQASVSTTGYVAVGSSRTVNGYLGAVSSSTEKCDTSKSFKTTCTSTTSTGESGWCSVQFQTSKNRLCIASEQVTDNNGSIYHFLNEAHLRYAE
jgi:hypothetical protein